MNRLIVFLSTLLCAVSCYGATVTGTMYDIIGTVTNTATAIKFVPTGPLAVGNNTYLDYPRTAKLTNGAFTCWLAGGVYDANFTPATYKAIRILVWPNDTNTYNFNTLAALATNATMFYETNVTIDVQGYVAENAGIGTNLTSMNSLRIGRGENTAVITNGSSGLAFDSGTGTLSIYADGDWEAQNYLAHGANGFWGNGSLLTNLDGTKVQTGTINSNKLDAATAAILALHSTGYASNAIANFAGEGTNTTLYGTTTLNGGIDTSSLTNVPWQAGSANLTNWALFSTNSLAQATVTNSTLPFVTLSARGVANGLSTRTNDGAQFGPDTAGSTTYGIQEAFDSIIRNTAVGPEAAGITLRFGPGMYYFTNPLVFSNDLTYGLKLEGSTLVDTRLVYAGTDTATNCVTICTGVATNQLPYNIMGHYVLRDICFEAIHDTNNILLFITNGAYVDIDNCNFTRWGATTNDEWGAGVSFTGDSSGTALVGLKIGANGDHATFVRNCFFGGLANGMDMDVDHLYAYGLKFASIGYNGTSTWPNTSPYSLGAAIIRRPGLDSYYHMIHFYTCNSGWVFLNSGTAGTQTEHMYDPTEEACDNLFVVETPGNSSLVVDWPSVDSSTIGASYSRILSGPPYSIAQASASQYFVRRAILEGSTAYGAVFNSATGGFYGNLTGLPLGTETKIAPCSYTNVVYLYGFTNIYVAGVLITNIPTSAFYWNGTSSSFTNSTFGIYRPGDDTWTLTNATYCSTNTGKEYIANIGDISSPGPESPWSVPGAGETWSDYDYSDYCDGYWRYATNWNQAMTDPRLLWGNGGSLTNIGTNALDSTAYGLLTQPAGTNYYTNLTIVDTQPTNILVVDSGYVTIYDPVTGDSLLTTSTNGLALSAVASTTNGVLLLAMDTNSSDAIVVPSGYAYAKQLMCSNLLVTNIYGAGHSLYLGDTATPSNLLHISITNGVASFEQDGTNVLQMKPGSVWSQANAANYLTFTNFEADASQLDIKVRKTASGDGGYIIMDSEDGLRLAWYDQITNIWSLTMDGTGFEFAGGAIIGNGSGLTNLSILDQTNFTTLKDKSGHAVGLDNWFTTLGRQFEGTSAAATQACLLILGDSWWQANSTPVLRSAISNKFGWGGAGYVHAATNSTLISLPSGTTLGQSAGWSNITGSVYGLNGSFIITTQVNCTLSVTSSVSQFIIHYLKQPGGGEFTFSLDGGAATTVDTDAASVSLATTNTTLTTQGTRRVTVTQAEDGLPVAICGIDCLQTAAQGLHWGARVCNASIGGFSSADFAGLNSNTWCGSVSAINPSAAMIMLGVNDKSDALSKSDFKANIETIVSRIRAASPNCDILLVSAPEDGESGTLEGDYAQAIRELCSTNDYALADFHRFWGSYADSNARWPWANTTHLSAAGYYSLVHFVLAKLVPSSWTMRDWRAIPDYLAVTYNGSIGNALTVGAGGAEVAGTVVCSAISPYGGASGINFDSGKRLRLGGTTDAYPGIWNNGSALVLGGAGGGFTNPVIVPGTLTATNGYVLNQLNNIPTNSIPASASGVTNFVLLNLTNTFTGNGGLYFVATNVAAAGSFILRKIAVDADAVWP